MLLSVYFHSSRYVSSVPDSTCHRPVPISMYSYHLTIVRSKENQGESIVACVLSTPWIILQAYKLREGSRANSLYSIKSKLINLVEQVCNSI